MTRTLGQRRGFTLTELLIALILLGVFALAASRLFRATVMLSRNSAESENRSVSFESGLAALRADVWRATKIEQTAEAVKLTIDNKLVEWPIDATTWHGWTAAPGTKLSLENSRVVLRVPASQGTRAAEFWLSSQAMLVEEMTR